MNIKKLLGNRIREIRTSRSLTQEALAEIVSISAKTLSQIELGNNFVSAETLADICKALNITPKILFDFEHTEVAKENLISEIVKRLENNPQLLKTIYKIVIALDY
ncbi:helix-turn-helix transcriptional regulator [bacterium]|nr:helix-turn-helix transcriptional regulator [bacterium]